MESFNARLRDELLDGEVFYTLKEGIDRDRKLAPALQCHPTPCFPGLQTAGTRSVRARAYRVAVCAPSIRSDGHAPAGANIAAKLTLKPDHSLGAGQCDSAFRAAVAG